MTETVNTVERHIVLFAELFQPAVRGLIVHGFAVPLDKQSVAFYPLVTTIEGGQVYFSKTLISIFNDAYVIRGTVLRESDTIPTSSRFIPNSAYIKDDNRFSPKGVE